jgi:hypothetical protein
MLRTSGSVSPTIDRPESCGRLRALVLQHHPGIHRILDQVKMLNLAANRDGFMLTTRERRYESTRSSGLGSEAAAGD